MRVFIIKSCRFIAFLLSVSACIQTFTGSDYRQSLILCVLFLIFAELREMSNRR